jgi:hypothetical protein
LYGVLLTESDTGIKSLSLGCVVIYPIICACITCSITCSSCSLVRSGDDKKSKTVSHQPQPTKDSRTGDKTGTKNANDEDNSERPLMQP